MAQENENQESNGVLLKWHSPEFLPHPREKRWLMLASVVLIGLIAYAIFTGSATMAIVFILLAGMYYLTHNQEPKLFDVAITELGIYVGETFYAYNNIGAFWIVYHPPFVSVLYLKIGSKNAKTIRIELNEQNPVEVRKLLAKEVPEIEDQEESATDMLIRLMRLQ